MNIPDLLQKIHDEKTLSVKQLNYLLDIHKKNLFSVHRRNYVAIEESTFKVVIPAL